MSAETIISIENVSKTFFMGDVKVPVLHEINLQIKQGDFVVIVGPSGSGKSTLLNLIGGLDRPTTGKIWFDRPEQQVSSFTDPQLTAYRREHVGFVFQFYNLVPTLTATENVQIASELSQEGMDPAGALELVGLEHRVEHFPSQMSGGEQQRVAIARAIAKNPRLLLCDEPTGALDLSTGRSILGVLHKLNQELGKTVVLITHNSAISEMATRTVHIGSGTIASMTENEHPISPEEISW
ncbi:putative ABC transporter ATP-binding protein [Polystyrenella longa]|uniref:Putative ABC transporter ATP-binding protein n=1 Tax=Polystyrenella longa TaxID=2528007 RepID=A0A518CR18_9PLAN|nr:ABC transporter ATP-binding protein [Polystyrenella longa]QDU81667.1 putative ABC transporter ATP-binding protein [Polystyrenella longa]